MWTIDLQLMIILIIELIQLVVLSKKLSET